MMSTAFVRLLVVFGFVVSVIVCPPVTEKTPVEEKDEPDTKADDEVSFGLEYERYLKEVVSVLESDETFKKKLEESNVSDIKSGEIAKHLNFVNHGIRTRLDEVKRKELDRLRQMMRLQGHLQNGLKSFNPEVVLPAMDKERMLAHLDHSNPNSFEVSDLAKLIQRATKDLETIDQQRRAEFKNYEMEKEVVRREELNKLDEEHRAEEEKKFQEMQKKHQDHPKLHHPGNEAQLQEVWEETDGLNKQDFDPKTFFHLHDTNGDGVLDQAEIEALFQKELDKLYDPNAPEDDMIERYEEMNRMREHVMNEIDKNKDKMISLAEFLESTKNEEFKNDDGWESLDKQTVYSEDELEKFQRQYEELQKKEMLKGLKEEVAPDGAQFEPKQDQQVKVMHQQQQQHDAQPIGHSQQPAESDDHLKLQHNVQQPNVQSLPHHPRAPL